MAMNNFKCNYLMPLHFKGLSTKLSNYFLKLCRIMYYCYGEKWLNFGIDPIQNVRMAAIFVDFLVWWHQFFEFAGNYDIFHSHSTDGACILHYPCVPCGGVRSTGCLYFVNMLLLHLGRGAEYCNRFVCLSVCL